MIGFVIATTDLVRKSSDQKGFLLVLSESITLLFIILFYCFTLFNFT